MKLTDSLPTVKLKIHVLHLKQQITVTYKVPYTCKLSLFWECYSTTTSCMFSGWHCLNALTDNQQNMHMPQVCWKKHYIRQDSNPILNTQSLFSCYRVDSALRAKHAFWIPTCHTIWNHGHAKKTLQLGLDSKTVDIHIHTYSFTTYLRQTFKFDQLGLNLCSKIFLD